MVQLLLRHPDLVSHIIHDIKLYKELEEILRTEFITTKNEDADDDGR